jgi:putative transposase
VIHLLRNSFKYTSRRDWPELAKDLKLIYTAPSADAALDQFAEFSDKWEKRCPAVIRLWTDAWAEFVPFLALTWRSARSSVRPTRSSRSTPDSDARSTPADISRPSWPMKCLYMALMGLDPTGRGRGRWVIRWKAALNAFDVAFEGRLTAAPN